MNLAEPQPTAADLNFSLGGIPVRVSPWFWAASALFGWGLCQSLSGDNQRELLRYLLAWIAVVFVSILVHEMGHALAYRACGQSARIVLYHFGGLAIPERWGRRRASRPLERMLIAAAGPLAQLALAAALIAVFWASGYRIPFPLPEAGAWLGLDGGRPLPSMMAMAILFFLLEVNILWPLLNLVPVPPLDGGQIVREGLATLGITDAERLAGMIGLGAGAAVALWAYSRGETYLAIMFVMLAVGCFQRLQESSPWRRWN